MSRGPQIERRAAAVWLVAAAALSCTAATAHAAPGDLDPKFSRDGKVKTSLGFEEMVARDATLQPDGKALVVGEATDDRRNGPVLAALVRYRASGKRDRAFADRGVRTFQAGRFTFPSKVLVQPDGKIVVCGVNRDGARGETLIARFNRDGSLDGSFGSGGIVTENLATAADDFAVATARQADGKLLVAGWDGKHGLLARFLPNGELDRSFSNDGVRVDPAAHTSYHTVAQQPDGKILVGGSQPTGDQSDLDLVARRFDASGDPDDSFGDDGAVAYSDEFLGPMRATDIRLAPDGRILVLGGASYDDIRPAAYVVLLRYGANGDFDTSFGEGGVVRVPGYTQPGGLAVEPNGEILIGYSSEVYLGGSSLGLLRLDTSGARDTTFGRDGDREIRGSFASDVLLPFESRALLVGGASGPARFILARFKLNPGRHDADADRIRDKNDKCPYEFGRKNRDGCPRRKR